MRLRISVSLDAGIVSSGTAQTVAVRTLGAELALALVLGFFLGVSMLSARCDSLRVSSENGTLISVFLVSHSIRSARCEY